MILLMYIFYIFHLFIFISLCIRVGELSVKFWFVEPEITVVIKAGKLVPDECHLVSVVGNLVQGLLGSNTSQILSPLSSTVQAVCKPAPVCNTHYNSEPTAYTVGLLFL